MFSSFGVVKSFLKAKLNKVKKETKKVEKETEKELVKEAKMSPAEAKIKSKNVEGVKKSNQKKAKLKLKILILDVLDAIWSIIKWFVGFLVGTFGLVGCCVILFVFVLMCLRFGLLKLDFQLPTGTITGTGTTQTDDCIQGGQVLTQGSLLDINIGSLSGTITPYQMNLLKTFQLVEEFLQADGVNKPYFDSMPIDVANKVYRGIPAVESSFYIFGKSDTSHDVLKDILDSSSSSGGDYWASKARDSFIGPHQIGENATLDYADYFNAWDGEDFIEKWAKKYPKPTDEKDHFWMPYSVAMSIMHTNMMGKYGTVDDNSNKFDDFKTYTYDRMAHFGIEANKDDCYQYIRAFLALSCYLQGQGLSFLNYDTDQGGKARIDFFCALFAASSDVDSQRSFENYAVNLDGSMKGEYSAHSNFSKALYGDGISKSNGYGSISNLESATVGSVKAITLNGKALDVPIFRYVYEKYKTDDTMSECWNHIVSVKGQFFTSYTYGFSCLLQGNHVVAELGLSLPVATGGSRDDCLPSNEFVETPGKFQGAWGDISSYIDDIPNESVKTKLKNAVAYVGTAPQNIGEDNYAYQIDKWRKYNGHGVVRYSQTNTRNKGEVWGTLSFGDSTYYNAACGAYSAACIISTMTGRYVNTVEVAIAVSTYEQRHPGSNLVLSNMDGVNGGAFTYTDLSAVIEENGLNVKNSWTLSREELDDCLTNNGMVLIVFGSAYKNRYTSNGHYVVIREKVDDGYLVYSSTNWANKSNNDYCDFSNSWEELVVLNSRDDGTPRGQIVYVTP